MPGIAVLNGFRAYAILGIVLIHMLLFSGVLAGAESGFGAFLIWGLLGNLIDVFFIVSGFLLFLPLVARSGDLGGWTRWMTARAARLLPAYWLCLTIVLVLVLVDPPTGIGIPSPSEVAVQFSTLQMPARLIDPSLPIGFGVDGPLWMISVIAGFYVVLPLVAKPYLRHPLIGLGLAALVTVVWKELALHTELLQLLSNGSAPEWATTLIAVDQLPGWAFSFALGMTGAWAYRRASDRWSGELMARRALQALPFILAVYAAFAYVYAKSGQELSGAITGSIARSDVFVTIGSSATRALLMAAVFIGPLALRRPFETRATKRMAELSYGLYLIHFVVMVYVAHYLGRSDFSAPADFALLSAIVLPISLAYAYASRRWVEQPVREWVRRHSRSAAPISTPLSGAPSS